MIGPGRVASAAEAFATRDQGSRASMHRRSIIVVVGMVVALTATISRSRQPYDVLIRNGRVLDGSGNP